MNENLPLVSVLSITYNQAPFIRQCLDGILAQHRDFPIEIIIHDDCSTDGTDEIIRSYAERYPDIIRSYFENENQYSKGVNGLFATFCMPHVKGRYVAVCEGDDWWSDPDKLRTQIEFLEKHHEYDFCCHRFHTYFENTGKLTDDAASFCFGHKPYIELTVPLCLNVWLTQPLSLLCRREPMEKAEAMMSRFRYARDFHFFFYLLKNGRGASLNRFMGVYRRHDGGINTRLEETERFRLNYILHKDIYEQSCDREALAPYRESIPLYMRHISDAGLRRELMAEWLLTSPSRLERYCMSRGLYGLLHSLRFRARRLAILLRR